MLSVFVCFIHFQICKYNFANTPIAIVLHNVNILHVFIVYSTFCLKNKTDAAFLHS